MAAGGPRAARAKAARANAKPKAKGTKGAARGKAKAKAKAAAKAPTPEPVEVQPMPAAVVRPALLVVQTECDDNVVCSWCGQSVVKTRCRSKGSSKYQCNVCNSKCVALSRMVGSWPTQDFKDLAVEQQQAFFASIAEKQFSQNTGHSG